MKITVNGESQAIDKASLTVAELLSLNKVEQPEMVSVQLNGQFVESKLYPTTPVQEKDEVDFLYFLGGGQGQ